MAGLRNHFIQFLYAIVALALAFAPLSPCTAAHALVDNGSQWTVCTQNGPVSTPSQEKRSPAQARCDLCLCAALAALPPPTAGLLSAPGAWAETVFFRPDETACVIVRRAGNPEARAPPELTLT